MSKLDNEKTISGEQSSDEKNTAQENKQKMEAIKNIEAEKLRQQEAQEKKTAGGFEKSVEAAKQEIDKISKKALSSGVDPSIVEAEERKVYKAIGIMEETIGALSNAQETQNNGVLTQLKDLEYRLGQNVENFAKKMESSVGKRQTAEPVTNKEKTASASDQEKSPLDVSMLKQELAITEESIKDLQSSIATHLVKDASPEDAKILEDMRVHLRDLQNHKKSLLEDIKQAETVVEKPQTDKERIAELEKTVKELQLQLAKGIASTNEQSIPKEGVDQNLTPEQQAAVVEQKKGVMEKAKKWFESLDPKHKKWLTTSLTVAGIGGAAALSFATGGAAAAVATGITMVGTKVAGKMIEAQRSKEEKDKNLVGHMVMWYDKQPEWKKKAINISTMAVVGGAAFASGAGVAHFMGAGKTMTIEAVKNTVISRVFGGIARGAVGEATRKTVDTFFGTVEQKITKIGAELQVELDKIKADFAEGKITIEDVEKLSNEVKAKYNGQVTKARLLYGARNIGARLLGALAGGKLYAAGQDWYDHNHPMQHEPAPHQETIPPVVEHAPDSDAFVRKGEGIWHVLKRQLDNNPELQKAYHYDPNASAHERNLIIGKLEAQFGYDKGTEDVRVIFQGDHVTAYELDPNGHGIHEYNAGHYTNDNIGDGTFEERPNQEHYEYSGHHTAATEEGRPFRLPQVDDDPNEQPTIIGTDDPNATIRPQEHINKVVIPPTARQHTETVSTQTTNTTSGIPIKPIQYNMPPNSNSDFVVPGSLYHATARVADAQGIGMNNQHYTGGTISYENHVASGVGQHIEANQVSAPMENMSGDKYLSLEPKERSEYKKAITKIVKDHVIALEDGTTREATKGDIAFAKDELHHIKELEVQAIRDAKLTRNGIRSQHVGTWFDRIGSWVFGGNRNVSGGGQYPGSYDPNLSASNQQWYKGGAGAENIPGTNMPPHQ